MIDRLLASGFNSNYYQYYCEFLLLTLLLKVYKERYQKDVILRF